MHAATLLTLLAFLNAQPPDLTITITWANGSQTATHRMQYRPSPGPGIPACYHTDILGTDATAWWAKFHTGGRLVLRIIPDPNGGESYDLVTAAIDPVWGQLGGGLGIGQSRTLPMQVTLPGTLTGIEQYGTITAYVR